MRFAAAAFSRAAFFARRCSLLFASEAKTSTAASVKSSPQTAPVVIVSAQGQIFL